MPKDHRSSERQMLSGQVKFSLLSGDAPLPPESIRAELVDISATGMGISTTTPLHKGQEVQFSQDQDPWQFPEKGVIIWCCKQDNGYRAGLEFVINSAKQSV